MDPNDYLPLLAVALLAVTTIGSIVGAWAMGRARGLSEAARRRDLEEETRERIKTMEGLLASTAEEIERLGEVQRFALKVIAEKTASPVDVAKLPGGRVITPH